MSSSSNNSGRLLEVGAAIALAGTVAAVGTPWLLRLLGHAGAPDASGVWGVAAQVGVASVLAVPLLLWRERRRAKRPGPGAPGAVGFGNPPLSEQLMRDLQLSEARLRAILDAEPECVKIIDSQGLIVEMNPAGLSMVEAESASQVQGCKVTGLIVPRHRQQYEADLAKARLGQRVQTTYEIVGLRGARRWVEQTAVALPDPERTGGIGNVLAVSRDVTERLAAERKLAESENRYRMMVEGADVIVWEVDCSIKSFTYVSPQAAKLGYPLERWYEPGFWMDRLHPADRQRAMEYCAAEAGAGRNHRLEYRMLAADGRSVWFDHVVSVVLGGEGSQLLRGVLMDITERKLAEQKAVAAEHFLRSAIDSIEAHTVVLDKHGRIHSCNRAWREFYSANRGQEPAALEGADYLSVCDRSAASSPESAEVGRAIRAALAGEQQIPPIEYPCHGADEKRWFLCTVRGFESGGERFAVVSHQRITEVKLAQERLRHSNEQLERARAAAESASRTKSEFLANMSHEIRTPLTAILGFADVLRDEERLGASPPERLSSIDTIQSAGEHLLTVINDILDLSKIEADRLSIERIETPLLDVLRGVESLCRSRAEAKGVVLTTTLGTPVPDLILTDPTRLRQILMNLVGNATKFTDSGQITVVVRAEGGGLRDGAAETAGSGPRLVIDVTDTGPGMSAEQASRLFQAFGQADATTSRKHGGTGLGLMISRRLAELMGGTVTLEWTTVDFGTCFRVALPLVRASAAKTVDSLDQVTTIGAAGLGESGGIQLSGRILLAEDGLDNQRLIALHLRRAGAVVEIADNGRIALAMWERARHAGAPFELIVTDMQMPEMDGYALATALRQRGSTTPIIALTAHAMAEDRERCMAAGCDDYSTKPIQRDVLLGKAVAWIGKCGGSRFQTAGR